MTAMESVVIEKPALSTEQLGAVASTIAVPAYDREHVEIGIVHLGPGAFHRAHQAWVFDQALATDPRWGISEVALKSSGLRGALAPQDGLYTVAILGASSRYRVIGAVREMLVASEDPQRVIQRLSAATTKIVTLTITEKGYCLDGSGALDANHVDIVADLAQPDRPASAIGYLVAGLRMRRDAGLPAYSVISCDNLSNNGRKLRDAVIALAGLQDAALADWIAQNVAFPRTMVDSIVPATDDALRSRVASATGLHDRWPVQREPFLQWVIADEFCNEVPDWRALGVTITDDVAAYESAKLRLLNGAHSSLAYIGLLRGHRSVSDAMADMPLAAWLRRLMIDDIRPAVRVPAGMDVDAYIDAVLERFRNPAIHHELAQIAWDGSQKLPFRLLATIAEALDAGRSIDRLAVPIAAWMQFVRGKARDDRKLTDPLAERLLGIADACTGDARADVTAFLDVDALFPTALRDDGRFVDALITAHAALTHDVETALH